MYSFVSNEDMVGNNCSYIEDFTGKGLFLNDLFGFFFATVETNNGYLGLLPKYDDKVYDFT